MGLSNEITALKEALAVLRTLVDGKQDFNALLDTFTGLSYADGNFIVGDGSTWIVESGNTARTSLGLGTGDSPSFAGLTIGSLDGLLYAGGIYNPAGVVSAITVLKDSGGAISVDWLNRYLKDSPVTWGDCRLSIDWNGRYLYNRTQERVIDWENLYLRDQDGTDSVNWQLRVLYNAGGAAILNWDGLNLYGSWTINSAFVSTLAIGTAPYQCTSTTLNTNLNADLLDGQHGSVYAPSGAILMYGVATAPTGWLLCNGAAVSRTTYAVLFAVIGTTFGVGDGSTTFNLPDLRDRFPVGAGTTYAVAGTGGAANHLHTANLGTHAHDLPGGPNIAPYVTGTGYDHHTSTSGVSGSTDNASGLPPYIGLSFIIKT